MLNLTCKRFARLVNESRDRQLNSSEDAFVSRHSSICPRCEHVQEQAVGAFGALCDLALDAEPSDTFDERVTLAFREGRTSMGFGYWSPALMGAAIAGIAVLCALTIVTRTADSPVRREPLGAAMRINRGLPSLNLDRPISRTE